MGRAPRRGLRSRVALAAAVALTLIASACVAPPKTLTVEVVVGGLHKPWDLGFTPDGAIVFTERRGTINAYVGGGVNEMAFPSDVIVNWESGMLGLAIDPDFATNRRIYTCHVSNLGGPRDVRIVRWVVNADYSSLSDRTDILTGIPVDPAAVLIAHVGCRPRFGPDGYLWVTTGDSHQATVPQNPLALGGKVLRIDTDGDPAPGNPGSPLAPEVYTYGHRNPQGIAFRPSDGKPYSVEHGTSCDDEVNALVAGANYGWDPEPSGGGAYSEAEPMTDLVTFPDALPAVWSSGCPTIAPSGATFLSGSQWAGWNEGLAMAVLKGQQLHILRLKPDGQAVLVEFTTITDQGRLRSAVQGPDGNLYLVQDADPGAILRVVPAP